MVTAKAITHNIAIPTKINFALGKIRPLKSVGVTATKKIYSLAMDG